MKNTKFPEAINIFGKNYKVIYTNVPSKVDRENRESLKYQIDNWAKIIRIYKSDDYNKNEIWHLLVITIFRSIIDELHLNDDDIPYDIDNLALGFVDMLGRNNIDILNDIKFPNMLNIAGKKYSVKYCENPSDVDHLGKRSLFGNIDPWTSTIRILKRDTFDNAEVWQTIIHEAIHGLIKKLGIMFPVDETERENLIDLLALGIVDVIKRNKLKIV